jgi:hypothetical protein
MVAVYEGLLVVPRFALQAKAANGLPVHFKNAVDMSLQQPVVVHPSADVR